MEITNADRVVFPDDGITKGDVVAYYALVADRMLPFITGRALTVERFPRRIDTKGRARAPLKFEHAFSELTEIANLGAFRGLPGRSGEIPAPTIRRHLSDSRRESEKLASG